MTISGIQTPFGGITPDITRTRDGAQAPAREATIRPVPTPAPRGVAAGGDPVPPDAPQGTDPALWQVLTPEERSFFARARAMGPLTYGPGRAPDSRMAGLAQGGRIDVRV